MPKPTRSVLVPNYYNFNGPTSQKDFKADDVASGTEDTGYRLRILQGKPATFAYSANRLFVLKAYPAQFAGVRALYGAKASTTGVEYIPTAFTPFSGGGYWRNLASLAGNGAQHVGSLSTELNNKTISKLHSKIREDYEQLNGWTFLGELRETIGMLRSPFKALREGLKTYAHNLNWQVQHVRKTVRPRRKESREALSLRRADALKNAISGSWLEFQFGVKPALSDAEAIVKAIKLTLEDMPPSKRYFVTGKDSTQRAGSVVSTSAAATCLNVTYSSHYTTERSIAYGAIYRRKVTGSTSFAGALFELLGFRLENFVPTVWELLPWSFLIDYFVNVGQMIECATTSSDGLVTCWSTLREESIGTHVDSYSRYDESMPGNRITSLTGQTSAYRELRRVSITRTPYNQLPMPTLQVTVPGWGSTKWANVVALIAQMRDFSHPSNLGRAKQWPSLSLLP